MKRKTSLSLSDEALRLRDALAQEMGISGAAVVEMALREMAARREVKAEKPSEPLKPDASNVDEQDLATPGGVIYKDYEPAPAPPDLVYEADEPPPALLFRDGEVTTPEKPVPAIPAARLVPPVNTLPRPFRPAPKPTAKPIRAAKGARND